VSEDLPRSFDELIQQSKLPVLVDFWAEWCGPCKMVSPVIQRLAREFKGRLLTVKVNVDQKQHTAARYQISSIPTIMLFYQGQIQLRLTGALPYEAIKAQILEHLPQNRF